MVARTDDDDQARAPNTGLTGRVATGANRDRRSRKRDLGREPMEDRVRRVAWAIAEAWWRKHHRRAAGAVPEAESSEDYAERYWQGWAEEARAAIAAMGEPSTPASTVPPGGGRPST